MNEEKKNGNINEKSAMSHYQNSIINNNSSLNNSNYGNNSSLLRVSSRLSSDSSQSFQRNDVMSMSVIIDNSSRRKKNNTNKNKSRLSINNNHNNNNSNNNNHISASSLAYGGGGYNTNMATKGNKNTRNYNGINRKNHIFNNSSNNAGSMKQSSNLKKLNIEKNRYDQMNMTGLKIKNKPNNNNNNVDNFDNIHGKNMNILYTGGRNRSNTTGMMPNNNNNNQEPGNGGTFHGRKQRSMSIANHGTSPKTGMSRRICLRSRSTWQPDETAEYCAKCEAKFSGWITSGKHHCRRCGRIFCANCCNLFVKLPDDWRAHSMTSHSWNIIPSLSYQTNNDRVCTDCHDNFKLVQENPRVQLYLKVLRLCMLTGFIELPWLWSCVDQWMGKYWRAASDELKSQLRVLQYELPTHVYTKKQRELLWANRHVLAGHSAWLLPLMKSVNWNNPRDVKDAEALLKMRPSDLKNFSKGFATKVKFKRKRGAQLGSKVSSVSVPWKHLDDENISCKLAMVDDESEETKTGKTKTKSSSTSSSSKKKYKDQQDYCYAQVDCLQCMCTRHCKSHIMPAHAIQLLSAWQAKGTKSAYFSSSKEFDSLTKEIEYMEKFLNALQNCTNKKKYASRMLQIKSKILKKKRFKLQLEKKQLFHCNRINPLPESCRKIIVRSFKNVKEKELLCYLPSMVQCLQDRHSPTMSALSAFLFQRTINETQLRNDLYWGLLSIGSESMNTSSNQTSKMNCQSIRETLCNHLPKDKREELTRGFELVTILSSVPTELEGKTLSEYLRTCVEGQGVFNERPVVEETAWGSSLLVSNASSTDSGFGGSSNSINMSSSGNHGDIQHYLEQKQNQTKKNAVSIAVPVAPHKKVTSILYDTAKRMTSAERPYVVQMQNDQTKDKTTVAFKTDDMRTDQILLNCIRLMDIILKRELGRKNGDYKLTTYRVLPTSSRAGLVEFVDNAEVLEDIINDPKGKQWGSIENYFLERARFIHNQMVKDHNRMNTGSTASIVSLEHIHKQMKNNFTRSLAGYCVVSYLLGVGDRHRHNIMLTHTGKIFNIDFGWCLGQDPKPFQPALRLDDFLIAGLGGKGSNRYNTFINLANQAYNKLRRHVSTFTTLLLPLTSDYGYYGGKDSLDSKKLLEHMYWRYLPGTHDEEASAIFPRKLNGEYDGAGIQKVAQAVSDAVHTEVHSQSLQKVGRAAVNGVTGGVHFVYKTLESATIPATNVIADLASAAFEKILRNGDGEVDGKSNENDEEFSTSIDKDDDWEFVEMDEDEAPVDEI